MNAEELIEASLEGNLEKVRALIAAGADVNGRNQDGVTALMFAAGMWRLEVVRELLRAGADVNAAEQYGKTPLMWACALVLAENYGIRITDRDPATGEPVERYWKNGKLFRPEELTGPIRPGDRSFHLETVRELIAAGADVNAKDKFGHTAIFYPCEYGNTELVRALIAAGACTQYFCADGSSPYLVASRNGEEEIIKLLEGGRTDYQSILERCSKNIENGEGICLDYHLRGEAKWKLGDTAGALADYRTALRLKPDNKEVLRSLRDLQETILKDLPEDAPIMRLTLSTGQKALQVSINGEMVTLIDLDKNPAEPEKTEGGEHCPQAAVSPVKNKELLQACWLGRLDKVRELIAAGADVNAEICGETPLLKAVMAEKAEIVRELLNAGADVNAGNKTGKTPLHAAAGREQADVLQAVLSVPGVNINAVNQNGDTALIVAAKAGILEAVQKLLEAGADPNVKNKRGQTALGLAKACRRTEVAAFLQSAGVQE